MSISFAPEVSYPNTNGGTTRPTILSRKGSHPNPVSTAKAKVPHPKLRAVSTGNILRLTRRLSKTDIEPIPTKPKSQEPLTSIPSTPLPNTITLPGPRFEQSPRPAHKPTTDIDEQCVYILTLKTTPGISDPMNKLREEHFPPHLNKTPAHVTLFHALPHSQRDSIEKNLNAVTARTKPFLVAAGSAFRMRQGVGISLGIGTKEAQAVREELRGEWVEWLSEQDKGGWRPHWTVMNKVKDGERVGRAFEGLKGGLGGLGGEEEMDGRAVGMELWRYVEGGKWAWEGEWGFRGAGRRGNVGVVSKGTAREGLAVEVGK